MLLSPEKSLFVRGTVPALLLSEAPVHGVLPPVVAPDGAVPWCKGWSLMPLATMCVVDGPGESGVLVQAALAPVVDGTGLGTMADWRADAERAGGAVVLSLARLPEVLDWPYLLGSGTSHGGFVPRLPVG
ncbi:hypothetical protein ACFYNO_34025 [Kitasatospora sp. NPDC006697]|uniref:hypothetical protein n=1 Tax=Kitasatospora sp. NPDC006697 TaxID=3364020 RepID=UPI00369513AA